MEPFPDAQVLIGTFEKLDMQAAIYSQDGKEWGTSPEFKLSSDEIKSIVEIISDKKTDDSIDIAGRKFTIKNRDDVSFSGIGTPESNKFAVRKTHNAVVVIAWGEGGPTLARGAEKIDNAADYMMNEGY